MRSWQKCIALTFTGCAFAALTSRDARAAEILVGEAVHVSAEAEDTPHVEPHLAVNPADPENLIIGVASFPVPGETHILTVYHSADGGGTWGMTRFDEAEGGGIDPWVAFDAEGTAYLVSLHPGQVRRSTDGGKTWTEPVILPRGDALTFDYTKLAVDTTGGTFDGRVYVIAAQPKRLRLGFRIDPISVAVSTDGGVSFSDPVHIWPANINFQNGTAAILTDGRLIVGFHEMGVRRTLFDSPRFWVTSSDDGGETFRPPSIVTEAFAADSPHLEADTSDGPMRDRVYAAWTGLGGEFHQYLAYSSDAGLTWSAPLRVSGGEAPRPTHHPALAVNGEGILGMAWMDSRPDDREKCFTFMFTASMDGGKSVLPNAEIAPPTCSNTPANEITIGVRDLTIARRWPDGGDYHGLVALPDGAFQAAWCDSRTGVFQLWTARIEVRR